jgi:hypothetical protein
MRVRTRLDGVKELHVADVVDVYLILKHHDESFPIEFDREDGCRESELADGRLTLLRTKVLRGKRHKKEMR